MFWHSQTTNDDYLGVEINEFVTNSIDSGAASAGWLCFANVEEKKFFQDVEQTHLKRMSHEMKVVGRLLDRLFSCN